MRIGIDLGGSKIEGLVLGKDGGELARRRAETPRGDYAATVAAVADLVAALARKSGADDGVPVGIGIPGTVSPATGLVKNANSTCLIGKPLDQDLARALGRPVRLANDADCFTISEATDGAGQEARKAPELPGGLTGTKQEARKAPELPGGLTGTKQESWVVFGVILGTGCGGGIAVDGKLVSGPNAIAGEWGHNPLPWPQMLDGGIDERPGPECYCGQSGCIETFVSGPGLERDFNNATGQSLTAAEIVAAARGADGRSPIGSVRTNEPGQGQKKVAGDAGNEEAEAALSRYEHRLARALASVINVIDPGVIVLGGGMSNAKRLYENVPALWAEWVFSDTVATRLRPAAHGDSSGVRGAAWLW